MVGRSDGRTVRRSVGRSDGRSQVEQVADRILVARLKARKGVSLPQFHSEMGVAVEKMRLAGFSYMVRGKECAFSATWSWRYLVAKGYVSRRRTCKRPIPPIVLCAMMKRWLHCVRSEMLEWLPPLFYPGACGGGRGSVLAEARASHE